MSIIREPNSRTSTCRTTPIRLTPLKDPAPALGSCGPTVRLSSFDLRSPHAHYMKTDWDTPPRMGALARTTFGGPKVLTVSLRDSSVNLIS